ncbi:exocyst complex component EXO70B1-like [Cicer arietinum]|uniref:Exocyst subunit Exo70 family protein n=1 Tax=Cicer arietinum TaxID=3827 RepID=A0A1S3E044_CICAR|nr:exocyst complex component EXO70B1-like [Cicer arietinum]
MHILIQIRSWLMQTTVWKYLGFTSAVVGLVCYALSSSFNHLFGNWNLLKIFLYSVFCFIICLLILSAMIWKNHSRRLRFRVQFAFLVLTLTSVYSFFSDRVMNGKPDSYSLISSAAFAIMSLSLSRQTQCGFEVDLLYFFLGCLIVQLMKIKWQLFIVGAGFSYSLIILRSSFPSIDTEPDNIQDEISVVIDVLSSQLASTDKITSSMIEQLRTCVNAIQHDNLYVINMFLEQLKEYFDDASELVLSEQNLEEVLKIDAISQETINNLQETIKLIVSVGFEKDCSSVYSSCRREYLEEFLIKNLFDFEKFSIENVNKIPWKEIRHPIKRWIKASKVAIKILFPTERRLCDLVFFGFSDAADRSFTDVCKGSTIHLLNFADALANGSRSPERLFRVLDVFEALRDLIPDFESLFCDEYSVSLRNEAILVFKNLGKAIVAIFVELENAIRQDQSKTAVSGGRLLPIVRYVMNYLRLICDYRKTLEQVFEDHDNHVDDDRVPSSSSLLVQMDRIMKVLDTNLEAKAKVFNDSALSCVFLMNSSSYILQKIKNSELGDILADDTIQKHQAKFRHNYEQYQMSSWNKVTEFLKIDNNEIVPSDMVEKSMKEKLESFNLLFEEICRVQSTWFVLDEQLREDIRISIERNLLPAYGNFIGRFQSVMELGKNTDKYIKYATNDIEARLNDLFQGS